MTRNRAPVAYCPRRKPRAEGESCGTDPHIATASLTPPTVALGRRRPDDARVTGCNSHPNPGPAQRPEGTRKVPEPAEHCREVAARTVTPERWRTTPPEGAREAKRNDAAMRGLALDTTEMATVAIPRRKEVMASRGSEGRRLPRFALNR